MKRTGPYPRKRTVPKWFMWADGWLGPQVQFQITPFHWGFGACWGGPGWKYGLRIGPLAVAVWSRFGSRSKERDWEMK